MSSPTDGPRPDLVAIGAAIRRHREARAWTQERLAHEAGVSRVTVTNIEAGLYGSGLGNVLDVAHAIGARLADLLREAAVEPLDETED